MVQYLFPYAAPDGVIDSCALNAKSKHGNLLSGETI